MPVNSTPLESYQFGSDIKKRIRPITDLLDVKRVDEAEIEIARLALQICREVRANSLDPQKGDDYFTLLDIYVSDNHPRLKFDEQIKNIWFEGMILHDLGESYGADLDMMQRLAKSFLQKREIS